ncbi:DUF5018 domain-containing protein [Siphonobacter aquaeclarae]|jgi:hypothetical protein|uniref:Uncharacterized protein n=1 Tax=Siphonobacter aquaeclarae TaxID=563176 RepID=A0A1G9ICP6_9BACT|nr:hypothetical protein [Siphonobacter aquaeclarae]MBO9639396.1 hypothetical protein [Siphonobacter aquaeclarae]SDL22989.1 hypothetical protein SAMN04488090_0427 [Siphonobacter aquaeclarae]
MKKLLPLLLPAVLLACDKPDVRLRNDDATLSALWVNVPGADENAARYNGVFSAGRDTVTVTVPRATTNGIDISLKRLKLRGSIPSDAVSVPAMSVMDMSQPFSLDVVSGRQTRKTYRIIVRQQ